MFKEINPNTSYAEMGIRVPEILVNRKNIVEGPR